MQKKWIDNGKKAANIRDMKYYKLLSQDLTSHQDTKWEIGVPITIAKEGVKMCSDQVLHCYNHPMLAVIFNPIHAGIRNPKLFEIEVDEIVNTDGLKFASKSQTLIKEISLPKIAIEQRVEFAIKTVKLVYKNESWNSWADKWLDGSDRTVAAAANAATAYAAAANAAANAASNAATAAAAAANAADAYAANAANAADAAAAYAADAYAAYAADAADDAAAYAADAAAYAADAAAYAADADTKNEFNKKMIEIIESIVDKQKS